MSKRHFLLFRFLTVYVLPVVILLLLTLGARMEANVLLFLAFGLVCIGACLVVCAPPIPDRQIGCWIFLVSLGLLYHTTLKSDYLIGTDVHSEYFYASKALTSWDTQYPHEYNGSALIGLVLPLLARVGIPLEVSFKAVLPCIFSFVPVLSYLLFRRHFSTTASFSAVLLIIFTPTFLLEVPGIGKQMVGGVFLSIVLYLLVSKSRIRFFLIPICVVLATIFHYSIGILSLAFVASNVVFIPIFELISRKKVSLNSIYLLGGLLLAGAASFWYLSNIASGVILDAFNWILKFRLDPTSNPVIVEGAASFASPSRFLERQEPLIQAALGLGFLERDYIAKAFWTLQYIIQILLVVGIGYLFSRIKTWSEGFCALAASAVILLGLTVFYPMFSAILNSTRFYHICLLVLAPCFVLGVRLVFRKEIVSVIILILYFLFTSGTVFEATKRESCSSLDIPYSYTLSAHRVPVTGIFTNADAAARAFIEDKGLFPVCSDLWGFQFLYEKLGDNSRQISEDAKCSYIFLTEWNGRNRKLSTWKGVGLRGSVPISEEPYWDILKGRSLLYQAGEARVYGPGEE